MAKVVNRLLNEFIGDKVLMLVTGVVTTIMSEEGPVESPLVLEGIIIDTDDDFLLMSNAEQTETCLVKIDNIVKIDLVNEETGVTISGFPRGEMN